MAATNMGSGETDTFDYDEILHLLQASTTVHQ
jgi:hypothetical protein